MKNKMIVWGLLLAMTIIVLPTTSRASSEKTNIANTEYSSTMTFQRRGRGRGRGRDDNNWNRGRRGRHNMRRGNRTRVVRQVYYRNGRRYVRTIRVHR